MKPSDFYDSISSWYHDLYVDWEQSMETQAAQLDTLIRRHANKPCSTLLDASCGIGTQAIGLSELGYEVIGSDVSPAAILRAKREVKKRKLPAEFLVADMRKLWTAHQRQFDIVISCDNSIPHLLSDKQILAAFKQMMKCTRVGGLCLVSVRDYAKVDKTSIHFKPYTVIKKRGKRIILFQTWEFHGSIYTISMYRIEESSGKAPRASVSRAKYYAISISSLARLMRQAGFSCVKRIDDRYFQPILIGKRLR